MKINLLIILLLGCNLNSFAQNKEFEFKNLTTENGLPSNESYFIYRDSRNYMWFATDQGVARFNGGKMEKYDLPDNVVFKIYEDNKGRIWFFSHKGKLAYFYKEAIYLYKYNDSISKNFKSILITNAYVNDSDEVIINSYNKNIRITANGTVLISEFKVFSNDHNIVSITEIKNKANQFFSQAIQINLNGNEETVFNLNTQNSYDVIKIPAKFWVNLQYGCISNDGQVFYFYYGTDLFKINKKGGYKKISFPSLINCLEFDKNNLWVGCLKTGAALLDTGLNILYEEPLLKNKSITSIRKDYEGGIWFSSLEKGVFYLKNSEIKRFTGDKLLNENIFCISNTKNSGLLLGNKDGVHSLSGNKISTLIDKKYASIAEAFTDSNDNLFVVGRPEEAKCDLGEFGKAPNSKFKRTFFLYSTPETGKLAENKYFLTTYYYCTYFDAAGRLETKAGDCLNFYGKDTSTGPGIAFVDSKEKLWLGTMHGLYTKIMYESPLKFKSNDTVFAKGITCMRQMYNDTYTIGIRFGGIVLMQDTNIVERITEKDGLLSNSVKYLLPLKDQLWVATTKGISIISFQSYAPIKYTITNIGKNDGFYNVIINQLIPFGSSMLAATSNGIYEIEHASQFLNHVPVPIYFYINSVSSYKGDTIGINAITLPYNKNRVVIKYSAVCFNLADEINYYYRFDNADTNWFKITSTELILENLRPGIYNLQIKASVTGEQRHSEVKALRIIIEKAWWQNNWLKLLLLIVLLSLVYLYLKYRVSRIARREQQNAALKTKMVELEQTALRSQMNPHFIFNCLTSIQQLIISDNKTDANEYLVKFARLIRKTLDLSASSFVSIDEETAYLKEYLALEQLRIPGQFEFSISVDENINVYRTEIPGMMLQPIIENSIRHGIKHLENKKGQIDISLKQQGQYILCAITDNGVGRTRSGENKRNSFRENKSYGMEIVTKRLNAISFNNKNDGTLEIEDLINNDGSAAGTRVTMWLPFKTK